MGLLDIFLPGNPVSPWLGQNRNSLVDSFAGMVGHGNDPRAVMKGAVTGLQHGRGTDEELMLAQQGHLNDQAAIEQERAQQDQTVLWLQEQGFEDLAEYARAGNGGEAWKLALERMNPETAQAGGGAEYGFTPIQFYNPESQEWTSAQPSNAGGYLFPDGSTEPPEGFRPASPHEINFGRALGSGQGKTAAGLPAQIGKVESLIAQFDTERNLVKNNITRAQGASGWTNTGFVGEIARFIPGLRAAAAGNLDALLTNIGADSAFRSLQQMRDNSPTGGALGQVTERELAMLRDKIATISTIQDEKQLDEQLGILYNYLDKELPQLLNEAYQRDVAAGLFAAEGGQPSQFPPGGTTPPPPVGGGGSLPDPFGLR
jgi:hypothetical protein